MKRLFAATGSLIALLIAIAVIMSVVGADPDGIGATIAVVTILSVFIIIPFGLFVARMMDNDY